MCKKIMKFFAWHSKIGGICTIVCIVFIVGVGIGVLIKKLKPSVDVVEINYFLGDNVPLHDDNYTVVANYAITLNEVEVLDKKDMNKVIEGNFIVVNITLNRNQESELKIHKIDSNDFKLKDHTGVYVPLNSIFGAIGWDAIDVHIANKEGSHIMSSTSFSTKNAFKDYNYLKTPITDEKAVFNIIFRLEDNLKVENELMVLEVDFYYGWRKHKRGSEIVLLPKPEGTN